MQLTPDSQSVRWLVTAYSETSVTLGTDTVSRSTVITPDRLLPWPVDPRTPLAAHHLDGILELGIDLILLALPAGAAWPAAEVIAHAAARRVGVEVMSIGAAARTYNLLVGDQRPVALAVMLPG